MKNDVFLRERKAQTAIEYMLLLTTVVAIVLIGLQTYLPRIREAANVYYNRVVPGIMGKPSLCGDGFCDSADVPPRENCIKCPTDCGFC